MKKASSLVFGLLSLSNIFLVCYLMLAKRASFKEDPFAINLSGKIYLGHEITLYIVIMFFALINNMFWCLVFLGTFWALTWIKILSDQYFRHK